MCNSCGCLVRFPGTRKKSIVMYRSTCQLVCRWYSIVGNDFIVNSAHKVRKDFNAHCKPLSVSTDKCISFCSIPVCYDDDELVDEFWLRLRTEYICAYILKRSGMRKQSEIPFLHVRSVVLSTLTTIHSSWVDVYCSMGLIELAPYCVVHTTHTAVSRWQLVSVELEKPQT